MCTTCGCSKGARTVYTDPNTGERVVEPNTGDENSDPREKLAAPDAAGGYRPLSAGAQGNRAAAYLHARAHRHGHAAHARDHEYEYEHRHTSSPEPAQVPGAEMAAAAHGTTIALEQDILAKNQWRAERNRAWLTEHRIAALNLVSAPGAGKTTLLERTICDLRDTLPIQVIEGDQATLNDAERIRATGCDVVQINTGTGCHLDAGMVWRALQQFDVPRGAWLMIENVGNLVCPALFDLGERMKVVVLSVTEGEDKPLKYPHMFRSSGLMLLNKIDLLPHLRFDVDRCIGYARQVNPSINVMLVSALTGAGMDVWYDWLREVEPAELIR
jgi:hydrogenase nickel incorporation protein HypB